MHQFTCFLNMQRQLLLNKFLFPFLLSLFKTCDLSDVVCDWNISETPL